jgi:hypothetical protein
VTVWEGRRSDGIADRRVDGCYGFDAEFGGICAEVVVAKAFSGKTSAFSDDIGGWDVVGVRGEKLEVKFTSHRDGRLLVSPWNAKRMEAAMPDWLVLVVPSGEFEFGFAILYRICPVIFFEHCVEFAPHGVKNCAMTQAMLAEHGLAM